MVLGFLLYWKEYALLVINNLRRIPEALKTKVKDELDRMGKCSIMAAVTEPTDWVNSIVVVEKPNPENCGSVYIPRR